MPDKCSVSWVRQKVSEIKITVKPLTAEQLPQVVALDNLCLGGLWSLEGYQRELASPNSTMLVLSVPTLTPPKEKIIGLGCLWAILEEAHITILVVHPDYQGQGWGKLLLSSLLQNARERQLERATLEVREGNEVALSLYQKFGFKIAGKRRGYYEKTGEDALILWRGDLAQPTILESLTAPGNKNNSEKK
ncbi:MAG: ribosomal protein S18-alanine N-acetyltransferase [Gomphosphaeria aponina SAG 52.96 = DSM 107014]|uniref:Ribosomal protein S18-alanine N-acetyltransferase n=1 Tax=Gomphosphaeria aponina SAG 52.96 = DSM 107014 TaxID=1521640 RepID=A0A941JTE8_9CHRO|nr:ribosomal protein S18-alanine N-acetyltransferase [Gomphosphaeria aponina SAG 52.96 = DSM 107014]